jgi:hypothetical protein
MRGRKIILRAFHLMLSPFQIFDRIIMAWGESFGPQPQIETGASISRKVMGKEPVLKKGRQRTLSESS